MKGRLKKVPLSRRKRRKGDCLVPLQVVEPKIIEAQRLWVEMCRRKAGLFLTLPSSSEKPLSIT